MRIRAPRCFRDFKENRPVSSDISGLLRAPGGLMEQPQGADHKGSGYALSSGHMFRQAAFIEGGLCFVIVAGHMVRC